MTDGRKPEGIALEKTLQLFMAVQYFGRGQGHVFKIFAEQSVQVHPAFETEEILGRLAIRLNTFDRCDTDGLVTGNRLGFLKHDNFIDRPVTHCPVGDNPCPCAFGIFQVFRGEGTRIHFAAPDGFRGPAAIAENLNIELAQCHRSVAASLFLEPILGQSCNL